MMREGYGEAVGCAGGGQHTRLALRNARFTVAHASGTWRANQMPREARRPLRALLARTARR
jgi:hypothetical protein